MRRPFLLPFTPLYWVVTSIRNSLFDLGILRSKSFPIPIICVGNISAGGTGKTPHTEWILSQFSSTYKMAVLSRGYGRKTKGFVRATETSSAAEIGDEPLQIAQRFPHVQVVVCEDRVKGVENLLAGSNPPDVIVLDDAFQHRYVEAGLYWLLTAFNDRYTKDYLLPSGNLREDIRAADRADIITVTKCPHTPNLEERENLREELKPTDIQTLSFSRMKYVPLVDASNREIEMPKSALLVTGIAVPEPLIDHLLSLGIELHSLRFKDHRNFTHGDVQRILNAFESKGSECIITTRKDFVRWPLNDELKGIPTFIQDIQIEMDDDTGVIKRRLERFISDFHA